MVWMGFNECDIRFVNMTCTIRVRIGNFRTPFGRRFPVKRVIDMKKYRDQRKQKPGDDREKDRKKANEPGSSS